MTVLDAMRVHLVLAPASGVVAIELAATLCRDGGQTADRILRRASILEPLNGKLRELIFLREFDHPTKEPSKVARDMARSLIVAPDRFPANFLGSSLLRNHGHIREAEHLARRAVVLEPENPRSHAMLWKLREKWGWDGHGSIGRVMLDRGHKENDERFYRTTDARFFPSRLAEFDDIGVILKREIFHGYLPKRPPIPRDRQVVAMGSCFAQHIRQFLLKRGRLAGHVEIPEGLNNTAAVRQFIEWVEGRDDLIYAYEKTGRGSIERWDLDKERSAFQAAFRQAGGFIVTVGVAEVWRDKVTGGVFWRGVPADRFDSDRHEHALTTVEENAANLRAVVSGIRRMAGDVPVILTLSPVPLIATMRPGTSIFAADAVSKSTLRLAIETVVQSTTDAVTYWPSFEAFRWLGGHLERRLYDGERNPRHPSPDMIGRIVDLFVDSYMEPAPERSPDMRGP